MLFYTLLFIASVVVALVILRLYNSLVSIGKTVYTAFLPSSKDGRTDHLEGAPLITTINETRTPWGWKDHSTPSTLARTHPAAAEEETPWGWPGSKKEIREHKPVDQSVDGADLNSYLKLQRTKAQAVKEKGPNVGWPYREEKFEFAGKDYKVTRKVKPKKTNLKATGKPWGW